MIVEQKFDVLALSETKLNGKGECEFACDRVRMSGVIRGSGLNSESGSETVCAGIEGSVIKDDVGEIKVW